MSQDVERWKRELTEAGWTEASATAWWDPTGGLYRGPYGAWKELQRRNRGETVSHDTQVKQEAPERCVLCGHSDGLREPEGHCVICGCSCEFASTDITGQRLPTWTDCELAVDESRATPLQKFIYEFEPGSNDRQWREGLLAALATVRREALKEAIKIARGDIPASSSYNIDYRRGGQAAQKTIVRRLEQAAANQKGEVNG